MSTRKPKTKPSLLDLPPWPGEPSIIASNPAVLARIAKAKARAKAKPKRPAKPKSKMKRR